VDLLTVVFLLVSEDSQDGRENHARAMDPGERFVHADWATRGSAFGLGSAEGKVGSREIEVARDGAEHHVYGAVGVAGFLAPGADRGDDASDQRSGGDEAELLMDLEHVGALIKQRLLLRIACGSVRG
jgi:hypothetical protein